jgi:deoxycytidine triphosphate deaminase
MIIHSKNHVTNVDEKSVQPNAIDIRCAELFEILADDLRIAIGENVPKKFFPQRKLEPQKVQGPDGPYINAWHIEPRTSYQFETNHEVDIPEGMAGWLIIRSTLSRNGIIMSGGLYDSGYKGMIGGTIHNLTDGSFFLEENCRIGQFLMSDSETAHLYDGHYNKNGGRSVE